MENKELLKKADIALADLANAGRLNPEQTDRFIRTVMDQPTIINSCRVVAMNGPQMKINKIGFGNRILRPAVSSTPLAASDRVKPDLSQIELNTKEVIATIYIPYDVMEDNIERANAVNGALQASPGALHQTIVDMIGERASVDLEELAILGDTASADGYLKLQDGFLKLCNANVVDAGGTAYSKANVKQAVKAMPAKYLRNRATMQHFCSVNNETEMRDSYGNRMTVMGDSHVQGNLPLYVFGSQVKGVALMPGEQSLFCDPLNLIFGIQRNIQIEFDKDIEARVYKIVLTARVAFQVEEINATVKTTGLLP